MNGVDPLGLCTIKGEGQLYAGPCATTGAEAIAAEQGIQAASQHTGILGDIEAAVKKYDPAYSAIKDYDNEYHAEQDGCSLATVFGFAAKAVVADVETGASVDGEGEVADAVDAGTDLVPYDSEWVSRQLAEQNLPGSAGYATTDAGRTLSAHAASRVFLGGAGRAPTSLATVDEILDTGTSVSYDSARMTVRVQAGDSFAVVDSETGTHVVTVMVPK